MATSPKPITIRSPPHSPSSFKGIRVSSGLLLPLNDPRMAMTSLLPHSPSAHVDQVTNNPQCLSPPKSYLPLPQLSPIAGSPNRSHLTVPATPIGPSPSALRKVYIGSARPLSSLAHDQRDLPRLAFVSATPLPASRAEPGDGLDSRDDSLLQVPDDDEDILNSEPLSPPIFSTPNLQVAPLPLTLNPSSKSDSDAMIVDNASAQDPLASLSSETADQMANLMRALKKIQDRGQISRRASDVGPRSPTLSRSMPASLTMENPQAQPDVGFRRQSTGSTITKSSTSNVRPPTRQALPLKGLVILVDVCTAEGDTAAAHFIKTLVMMGARVSVDEFIGCHFAESKRR